MQITYEKYSPSIILNCARYLGSKLPPNSLNWTSWPRAWRTFSCIDPTARGNEWTVGEVKENDTRNCCHRRPQWDKSKRSPPPPWKIKKKSFHYMCGLFSSSLNCKQTLCDVIFIRWLY